MLRIQLALVLLATICLTVIFGGKIVVEHFNNCQDVYTSIVIIPISVALTLFFNNELKNWMTCNEDEEVE